ncbi:MAG: protein kinase domain-containing protein [bacterium]|jgi:serine/threonine protein kinase
MDLRPGERFERYEIERLLAETRMSKVWMARDTEENRTVALKVIRRIDEKDDMIEAARFGAMLQQMLSACDERVVKVHRYGETGGWFFIDMEYVEGRDVSEILRERGRLAPDTAVKIARSVAATLDNLHNFSAVIDGRQVISAVHGDLKPKNIRIVGDIDGEFSVKVLDFGTAKALSQSKPGGTRTPAWTPAYASPELLDRREMNPLSDRWALGVTLYEMVSGRVPFGAGKSVEEIENQIRCRPHMPDLEIADCPAALHAILYRLLDPNAKARYQSARELLLDLKRYPEMPEAAGYQGETVRSGDLPPVYGDETRRSDEPPPAYGDETRRSDEPPRNALPALPARAKRPLSKRAVLIRTAAAIVAAVLVMWLLVREGRALNEAQKLASDLAVDRISVTEAREQFEKLRSRPLIWVPKSRMASLLSNGLTARGDAIITRFRSGAVRIAEWRQARKFFEQAHDSDPRNEAVRGRLRLCDAHLLRYRGQAEKSAEVLASAADRFREAGAMLKGSPDPWLGLAMLEIYNRKDPEQGAQALEEAARRSYDYKSQARWVALLAGAYRARAEALEWEADQIAGTLPDQAEERLEQAAAMNEKAIEWYSKIPLHGDSLAEIERCRASVEEIRARIEDIREGDGRS